MATIVEVKKLALDLPEKERAVLAANLLESLPGVLWDEDEGIAEALRRDAEIDVNPEQAISLAQLDSYLRKYDDGFVVICSRGSLFNLLPLGTRARSRFHLCANAL